jgi:hypothetical protein
MHITITPNGYRAIDETSRVTFFTLSVGGATYKWHANTSALTQEALHADLTAQAEAYLCGIHRKMYLEEEITPETGETELEAWARWIEAGCKNTRQTITMVEGEPVITSTEDAIPVTPWKDTRPAATVQDETVWICATMRENMT